MLKHGSGQMDLGRLQSLPMLIMCNCMTFRANSNLLAFFQKPQEAPSEQPSTGAVLKFGEILAHLLEI